MKGKALILLSLGLLFLIQARGICWSQTTTLVSVDSAGAQDPDPSSSSFPSISAGGRYVAFDSNANELVIGDTNDRFDIFVHDRDTDEDGIYDEDGAISTVRVSVDDFGSEGSGHSRFPSISADGMHVAFESNANDLVVGDTNPFSDIFVHDLIGGTTTLVSVDSAGVQDPDPSSSSSPSLSSNGRYVAFQSDAALVVDDTNGSDDIFVHDVIGGTTILVSVDSAGNQATEASVDPSISGDGRYVAFSSRDTDLVGVGNDNNGKFDIFVHDLQTVTTIRVSVASGGGEAHGDSNSPSISDDGRYVAFDSDATDLVGVGNDNNGKFDIFVHDLQTVTTIRVSVASGGDEGNGDSYSPSISGDGRYVAFRSFANNLLGVGNDNNGKVDIFVHDRDADGNGTYDEVGGVSTVRVSVVSGGGEADGESSFPSITADGRYVAFESNANDLVTGDINPLSDIFVYEREDLPPNVDSTNPANNANGVGVGAAITATFSEPMNGSTIDTNTFTMDNGVTGMVTYNANSSTARFTPTSKLDYDTTYTATITTAAQDLAGNPLSADYTWIFTTQSEQKNSGGSGPCFIATAASDWADF